VFQTNGATDTQANDPNFLRRPASHSAAKGAATLWSSGTYGYDGAGNVTKMGTAWFEYWKGSRIKTGTLFDGSTGGGTQKQQSYTYDGYGNILSITTQVGAGTPVVRNTPSSASTNRLTGAVAYDAAGSLTSWNGASYVYGPFNEMWHMTSGAEDWIYLYNADDERVWGFKAGANFSRWTLRDLGNRVVREYANNAGTWSVERDYVYRDGSLLAAQTPAGVRHFSLDHLGTPRLITNSAGTQVAYHAYYPFGEEATSPTLDTERLKFTGHERDLNATTGSNPAADDLDYMHARFCSPLTGRFLSVDPVARRAPIAKPQEWNRYSLNLNNPLRFVDPDGRVVQPANIPSSPSEAIEFLVTHFRNWWAANVMMVEDPAQAAAREQIENIAIEGAAAILIINTFADIFDSATPQESHPDIRRKEGTAEDARDQFNDAVDPGSVQEKGGGVLVGKDKQTDRTLIFREKSTDPEAVATIEEQQKSEIGKIRSRKIRFESTSE
jgi:RHS repeat-associated protein